MTSKNVLFKDADDYIVAVAPCNTTHIVAPSDLPRYIINAHKNAIMLYELANKTKIKFQEKYLGINEKKYRNMYNYILKLKEAYSKESKLFSKNWMSEWATATLLEYKVWRVDLEAIHQNILSKEEFYSMVSNQDYQNNPREYRKYFLGSRIM